MISEGLTEPTVVGNVGDARNNLYQAIGAAYDTTTDCPVQLKAIENELMACFYYMDS